MTRELVDRIAKGDLGEVCFLSRARWAIARVEATESGSRNSPAILTQAATPRYPGGSQD